MINCIFSAISKVLIVQWNKMKKHSRKLSQRSEEWSYRNKIWQTAAASQKINPSFYWGVNMNNGRVSKSVLNYPEQVPFVFTLGIAIQFIFRVGIQSSLCLPALLLNWNSYFFWVIFHRCRPMENGNEINLCLVRAYDFPRDDSDPDELWDRKMPFVWTRWANNENMGFLRQLPQMKWFYKVQNY